ncbi:MAG: helix-turn-helix domain-containing protein [Chitinophagales bacterium]|nr:helix-turn-helix domain-containing protein [Chitinophagales bacterium]
MKVICLESVAFYQLVEQVVSKLKIEKKVVNEEWIDTNEVMALLKIKSKTTLQKLRDEGAIRYSELTAKHFLYFKPSVLSYIEKNAKDIF